MSTSERPAPPQVAGPAENAAARKPLAGDSTGAQPFRRRRNAARRLPALETGEQDPLFSVLNRDRWTSTRTLHVECGRRTAWLYGGRVKQLIEKAGLERSMFDHSRKVWMIPIDRADDVMVYAEHFEGRFTTVEAVDR